MTMPTYHITIADKIKAYRNKNNLSLKEFGRELVFSADLCYNGISEKPLPLGEVAA